MTAELEQIYERIGTWLTPEEEVALFSVSVHETAHGLVAARLGLDADELVVSADAGVCVHRAGTSLENAAVSWAGVMGEAILNTPHASRTLPKRKLTGASLLQWIGEVRFEQLSTEDRQGIQEHSSKFESAKVAFGILSENRETLQYLAERLAVRSRKSFAESKNLPPVLNQRKLERFVAEKDELRDEEQAAVNVLEINRQAEDFLASLLPVSLPTVFNVETFMAATGAIDSEIREFCAYKVLRERNQVGLGGVPEKSLELALEFFPQTVCNRDGFIHTTRQFYQWRRGETQ